MTTRKKRFSSVREMELAYGFVIPQEELDVMREILLRNIEQKSRVGSEVMRSPEATREYLKLRLAHCENETFTVLYLDSQHQLIKAVDEFTGTIDSCSVYPRVIVQSALKLNAAAVILSHNHPSGVEEPSAADRHITDRIKNALEMVDVRVLDHFVVGTGVPVSFAERGWL